MRDRHNKNRDQNARRDYRRTHVRFYASDFHDAEHEQAINELKAILAELEGK